MNTHRANFVACWFVVFATTLGMSAGFAQVTGPDKIIVTAGDTAALIDAIESNNAGNNPFGARIVVTENLIDQFPPFVFTEDYLGSGSALPTITRPLFIETDAKLSPGFGIPLPKIIFQSDNCSCRLFSVSGALFLDTVEIQGFSTTGKGGAINANINSLVQVANSRFVENHADAGGGAIALEQRPSAFIFNSLFEMNSTNALGGAILVEGGGSISATHSAFLNNTSVAGEGCAIDVEQFDDPPFDPLFDTIMLSGEPCPKGALNLHPRKSSTLSNNTIDGSLSLSERAEIRANLLQDLGVNGSKQKSLITAAVCTGNGLDSLGYNIASDASCNLDQPTDLPNTDPMTAAPDANGIIALLPGSPAIDSGAAELLDLGGATLQLPCGTTDIRGLGRPQDANDDGVFECDRGAYEVQGGPDIGPPQSAAYFDPTRLGEGVFTELLPNGQVFVSAFTYAPANGGMAWWVGLGKMVGNSVVVEEMDRPMGGVFGAAFDASKVSLLPVGSLSLVFPSCEAAAKPGRLAFQAFGGGFEDLLVTASRLSSVLNCSGPTTGGASGRSGSFFDPARSGEGVIVEWLTDGTALLIFYTYDAQGNQFWTISDTVSIDGSTLTANMLYPEATTSFGAAFNGNEISMANWGTITLEYQPGCNAVKLSYNSVVSGFGAGSYDYARLTKLDGTNCNM